MKLTQKQKARLQGILYDLERAERYMLSEKVAGVAIETKYPNGSNYTIVNQACSPVHAVAVVDKYIGSDLTGLYSAKKKLAEMLSE